MGADTAAGTRPLLLSAVGCPQVRFSSNQLILRDQTYSSAVYLPWNYDISELLSQNQAFVGRTVLAVDQNMHLGVTQSIFFN